MEKTPVAKSKGLQQLETLACVADKLEKKLNENITEDSVEVSIPPSIGLNEIHVIIGKKFMEISEAIAEGFSEYCEEENLTDEECEKAYEEAYLEELEKINEENMINVKGVIETPILKIEFMPQECEGDYDWSGMYIVVVIKELSFDPEYLADVIANVILSVYRAA
jgi:glutaredoxin